MADVITLKLAVQQSMVDIYALASQYAGAESMPLHLKYAGLVAMVGIIESPGGVDADDTGRRGQGH